MPASFGDTWKTAMESPSRFFYGWVVVLAAALGQFFGAFPIVVFSFSVFAGAYSREFHGNCGGPRSPARLRNVGSGRLQRAWSMTTCFDCGVRKRSWLRLRC